MADVLHFGGSKDGWDKLDVLGRLVSGVVLAVIAFILKTGADDIAAAQQRGELVRSLITDLTTRDQAARQDIALIALDHSIGERTPQLVVEIAERLASDTTGYAGADRARGQRSGACRRGAQPARIALHRSRIGSRAACGTALGARGGERDDGRGGRKRGRRDYARRAGDGAAT
ncbi:MAG: hypothetical protein MUF21_15150 [Gemmatimonadaceae bacterium]|nr:hypothetical protein [Gemmatimonadaceae bacterium]